MKHKLNIFLWTAILVLSLINLLTACQAPPVILDWFTVEYNKYGDPGEKTMSVNFYAHQDHHPVGYLGTLNIIRGDAGIWRVDEIVDIIPFGYTYTEEHITNGIEYSAINLLHMLNRHEYASWWWIQGSPDEFEQNRHLYWEIQEFSRPDLIPEELE